MMLTQSRIVGAFGEVDVCVAKHSVMFSLCGLWRLVSSFGVVVRVVIMWVFM